MTTLTVTLSLPPPCLLPNNQKRSGRFARWKSATAKAHRTTAKLAAMESFQKHGDAPLWDLALVTPTFYLRDRRGLTADQDGRIASLKWCMDGIAEAGVVKNDRGFRWGEVRHEVDAARPRVELLIELLAAPSRPAGVE